MIRLALSFFAASRGYDRFAAVVRSVDSAHLGTLLLALTDGWCFHGWDLDSEFERDCRRWVKLVASSCSDHLVPGCAPIPLLQDDTFVRLCEVAADVYTWEGGGDQSENFQIEFDEYVRPAWLVLGDELEWESDNERP